MKALLNFLLLLPLLVSIPACAIHSSNYFDASDLQIEQLIGTWEDGDTVYVFERDGELHSPEHTSTSANSWEVVNDTLILTFLDSPIAQPRKEHWKILFLRPQSMTLQNQENEKRTFDKISMKDIRTINGELYFLERIALPPEIVLRIDILQNNKILHSSLHTKNGNAPIPFNTYFSEDDIENEGNLLLSAIVYYQENAIFHTENPTNLPLESDTLEPIRLIRSDPYELVTEDLEVPLAYSFYKEDGRDFAAAQLYLQEENLFFLLQQKGKRGQITGRSQDSEIISWGHWNQTSRGHGIELLLHTGEALLGSVNPNHALTFENLPSFENYSPIHFKEIELSGKKSRSFQIIGEIKKNGMSYSFTPCHVDSSYPLEITEENIQITQSTFAQIEAQFSRKDNRPSFILNSILSIKDENLCPKKDNLYPLENTYWRLLTLDDKEIMKTENAEPHLILRINESNKKNTAIIQGDGSGSDGCNSFFLSWKQNSSTEMVQDFDLMLGGATMRLCNDEVSAQVTNYMQALDKADNYTIKGSILELKQQEEVLASFEAVDL